jgi:hypothetical protein
MVKLNFSLSLQYTYTTHIDVCASVVFSRDEVLPFAIKCPKSSSGKQSAKEERNDIAPIIFYRIHSHIHHINTEDEERARSSTVTLLFK